MASTTPVTCDRRGEEGRLYYNTGALATPVWAEHVGLVGDLSVADTEDEEELTVRDASKKLKTYVTGKSDLTISGQQVSDPDYEGYQYMNQSRDSGDPTDWLYLTGAIADEGNVGWRGEMRNKDRTINNPATGAQTQNFSLRPAACAEETVRPVQVSSGGGAIEDYDPTTLPVAGP